MTRTKLLAITALVLLMMAFPALGGHTGIVGAALQEEKSGRPDGPERVIELDRFERAAKVVITPGTDPNKPKFSFRAGSEGTRVPILVSMTNTTTETMGIALRSKIAHYRPRLLKDGKLLPYSERMAKAARAYERYGPSGSMVSGEIKPGETVTLDYIDLADWYGPLEPGRYELIIKYRFRHGGRPVETNKISFEIVP